MVRSGSIHQPFRGEINASSILLIIYICLSTEIWASRRLTPLRAMLSPTSQRTLRYKLIIYLFYVCSVVCVCSVASYGLR